MGVDVSVVVPTRNRSTLLTSTLRSVLWQRDVDFEIIVVDEASTDATPEVLAAFGDSRIRVIRHDTARGVSIARNRGAAEARGEWIAFLDDDDLWAPNKLALQLQAARENGALWVYVGHVNINLRHRVTGGAPPLDPDAVLKQLPQSNVVPGGCSGVMMAKRALKLAGEFDPQLQPLADWDLWLRLAHLAPPACVPKPLVAYRVHGSQMSLDASRVQAEFDILAARHGEGNRAILYRYLGWWALRVKRHRDALRFFVRACLQRRPEYPLRVLAADLASLAAKILGHRLRVGSVGLSRSTRASEAHGSWRAEGQAWVDALLASQAGETVASQEFGYAGQHGENDPHNGRPCRNER